MADTQLELDYTSVDLKLHEAKRVVAALTDALTINAVSDHEEYATVKVEDMNIIITPVGVGTANITVTAQAEEADEATANITVNVTEENVSLNDFPETNMTVDDEIIMTLTTNADDYTVSSETPSTADVVKMFDEEHDKKQFKIVAKAAGTVQITVTATKEKYKTATKQFNVIVKEKPATVIEADRKEMLLVVGGTDFINVTTDAATIKATASDPQTLEVAEHNKQIRVTALKEGLDQTITISATAAGCLESSIKVKVNVGIKSEEIKEFTYLTLPVEEIVERKSTEHKITVTSEENAVITTDADSIEQLTAEVSGFDITITGSEVGEYVLKITATHPDKTPVTRDLKIKILEAYGCDRCDPIRIPAGGHFECNYGARAYKPKDQVMEEYVEKFKDYENTSNLKLTTSVRINVVDKKSAGKFTTNVSCKEIIRNVITGKYGNMSFINDSRAKSFIALVYGLTRADYGSNISISQKYTIIKYVVDGHGLKID